MATKTYDCKKVLCVVGGIPLSGFSDGDVVDIERNEDTFTLQVGADGESTRSKSNNRSGRFTFHLAQSSAANALLSALAKTDETSNNGAVAVMVKDASGGSVYQASQAWIVKPPTAAFKRESDVRDWVLETGDLEWFEGGNS
jgi:hypothetical protein